MNPSDDKLEQQLMLLREHAEPTLADKQRLLAALRGSVRAPHAAAGRPRVEAGTEPARASLTRTGWAWLGGALLGGAAGVALGFAWGSGQLSSERHEPALGEPPRAAASAAPTPPAEPAPIPPGHVASVTPAAGAAPARTSGAPRTPARAQRRAPAERSERAALGLGDALDLLHQAERALHAGDAALALALLGDLDRRAERSSLRQERLTTLVLALCGEARVDEAQATRQELAREFPESIYSGRLARSCAASDGQR